MDIEEYVFNAYKDNAIMLVDFKKKVLEDKYHIMGDNAICLINRIYDYQRARYGDTLDASTFTSHSREELIRLSINARMRRKANLKKERR